MFTTADTSNPSSRSTSVLGMVWRLRLWVLLADVLGIAVFFLPFISDWGGPSPFNTFGNNFFADYRVLSLPFALPAVILLFRVVGYVAPTTGRILSILGWVIVLPIFGWYSVWVLRELSGPGGDNGQAIVKTLICYTIPLLAGLVASVVVWRRRTSRPGSTPISLYAVYLGNMCFCVSVWASDLAIGAWLGFAVVLVYTLEVILQFSRESSIVDTGR